MTGKTKWEVPSDIPRFSGVLSTAGGVVFTGQLTGEFEAFDANDGKKLWQFQTGSGIEGQPVTWQQDGVQYVAVTSGYGGVYSLFSGDERLAKVPAGGSLWVFAVKNSKRFASDRRNLRSGRRRISPPSRSRPIAQTATPAAAPQQTASADQAQIDQGKVTFAQKCSHCHGPNMVNAGTITPDLRRFPDDRDAFLHHGEARQEQQDAALGRPSERRSDRAISGPTCRAGEIHENLAGGHSAPRPR